MELFDSTNIYYASSSALPTQPAPHFAQTIKVIKQLDIKKPNYNRIQIAKCQITLIHKTKLKITGTHPILPKNPFMVKVNLKEDEQLNHEIDAIKKDVKVIRLKFQEQARPFFNSMMPAIIMNLINEINLDITFQRGQNPFIHQHDFTQTSFNVMAQFRNQRQSSFILKMLDELFVPTRIKLLTLGKDYSTESARFQSIDIQNHQTKIENIQLFTSQDISQEISKLHQDLQGECFQVIYIDFPKHRQLYLYQLYLTTLIFSTLQNNGCFVFRTKDIHLPQINYYLYMYALVFQTVVIERSDENHSLLQNSIYVGCYGYQQNIGRGYIQDLLKAFDCLRRDNDFGLFDYKIMPADNDFEKELTQFQSSLHKHRKSQLEIFQWSAQQLTNGVAAELIVQQIIKDREQAQLEDKEQKEHKDQSRKQDNWRNNHHHHHHHNNNNNNPTSDSYKKQNYNSKLMNPVPQVQQIQTNFGASPDIIRRKPKPQSVNQIVPVSKDKIKQKEDIKLQKLLTQENHQKKDKKDSRDERLSRFQR